MKFISATLFNHTVKNNYIDYMCQIVSMKQQNSHFSSIKVHKIHGHIRLTIKFKQGFCCCYARKSFISLNKTCQMR